MSKPKAILSWSSGKDSAWAAHEVARAGEFEVVAVLTTVTETYDRVSMHGVRAALLAEQALALGLPLIKVLIPAPCPNGVYEQQMSQAMDAAVADGVTHVIFGDLFLEDIREYRESRLAQVGMKPAFPLWGRDTAALARAMVDGGLRATITCIDPRRLDRRFAGRTFDHALLDELPEDVDPCGEKGEFHTVVTAGPMFDAPIPTRVGEVVEREGFVFADVLPTHPRVHAPHAPGPAAD